jgi:hypothetical protein
VVLPAVVVAALLVAVPVVVVSFFFFFFQAHLKVTDRSAWVGDER